jgi:hypothetical protein
MTFEIARRGLIMGLGALPCAALAGTREPATLLLRNAQVFDGTEGRLFARNVRVTGDGSRLSPPATSLSRRTPRLSTVPGRR